MIVNNFNTKLYDGGIINCMTEKEIKELLDKTLGKNSEIISPLIGGMMNVSYIVKNSENKKYVLYIPTKHANEMVNRSLEKENQRIVYSLGLTSKNVYFDIESGIKINEFIEGESLDKMPTFSYDKIASLLHKLHSSIMLSREDYNPFRRFIDDYEKEALTFQKEASPKYKELRDFLFQKRGYLESGAKVICHNDAQRSNIIKTPKDDYYLIDFEFVGNNDPIYDIATFGNGVVKEGRTLLDVYFNNNPSQEKIKRFYLWRIFISLQWYNVAIAKHYRGEGKATNFDFLMVANHFLQNAQDAYNGYNQEVKETEMKDVNDDTIRLIIETLDKVRHFLRRDGGDCEFVSFKDGIVYLKLHGACAGCIQADFEIKEMVEVILQEEVPGVLEIKLVE